MGGKRLCHEGQTDTKRRTQLVSLFLKRERMTNIVPKGEISEMAQQRRDSEAGEIFGALAFVAVFPINESAHSLLIEREARER